MKWKTHTARAPPCFCCCVKAVSGGWSHGSQKVLFHKIQFMGQNPVVIKKKLPRKILIWSKVQQLTERLTSVCSQILPSPIAMKRLHFSELLAYSRRKLSSSNLFSVFLISGLNTQHFIFHCPEYMQIFSNHLNGQSSEFCLHESQRQSLALMKSVTSHLYSL